MGKLSFTLIEAQTKRMILNLVSEENIESQHEPGRRKQRRDLGMTGVNERGRKRTPVLHCPECQRKTKFPGRGGSWPQT